MNDIKENEVYCRYCSKPIKETAVICPYCGSQAKELKVSPVNQISVKSKAVAVVLAIFFSFWSWLYTYGRSQTKFWFGLIAYIVTPIVVFSKTINSDIPVIVLPFIFPVVIYGIWIYAIVDNSIRSYKFYINYPNEQK